jgi:hypothetical protein
MKDFTRVCRIEPQAVGAWLKQTSVKSNFQHVVYTIFFRRPQKKTANIRLFLESSEMPAFSVTSFPIEHNLKSDIT